MLCIETMEQSWTRGCV